MKPILATLTFAAGIVVAVNLAPGPAFDSNVWWAGLVKVAHGYLAYMGVNAGVTAGALGRGGDHAGHEATRERAVQVQPSDR